nr:N-acetylmuramoyl-L-alanine amidase [Acinetobacter phage Phanie]
MMINEAKKHLNANLEQKYRIIDYYNKHCLPLVKDSRKYRVQYNDNWCATFTSVIAHKCGLTKTDFPYECGVEEQVKLAKLRGKFYTDTDLVQPNDLIIYDWDVNNWADHVGIVIEKSDGTIKVIEGNIRNTVGYRTVPITSKSIRGFIRVGVDRKMLDADAERERIGDLARDTVAGKYGNGLERQRALGADYKAVQQYINVYYK